MFIDPLFERVAEIVDPQDKLSGEAIIKLVEEKFTSTNKQCVPCPVCGSNSADIQPCHSCKCKLWPDKHGTHLS